jgi:WD40 repeat protein
MVPDGTLGKLFAALAKIIPGGMVVLTVAAAWAAAPVETRCHDGNGSQTAGDRGVLHSAGSPARLDPWGDPLPGAAVSRCGSTRPRHGDLIRCLAVSPDGKYVVSAGEGAFLDPPERPNPLLRLWDAATGKELRQFRGHVARPVWVVFSPDGQTLASRATDGTGRDGGVRLWDVATGKLLRVLDHPNSSHSWYRNAVAFSPDGRTLASSGGDGDIRLWNVGTGEEIRCWQALGASEALTFSPDGRTLASDGGAALWLLDVSTGGTRLVKLSRRTKVL